MSPPSSSEWKLISLEQSSKSCVISICTESPGRSSGLIIHLAILASEPRQLLETLRPPEILTFASFYTIFAGPARANVRFIYPFCPLCADPFYLPPVSPVQLYTMIININVETQARRKLGIWSTGAGAGSQHRRRFARLPTGDIQHLMK